MNRLVRKFLWDCHLDCGDVQIKIKYIGENSWTIPMDITKDRVERYCNDYSVDKIMVEQLEEPQIIFELTHK